MKLKCCKHGSKVSMLPNTRL
eukprot:Gb_05718 [translate_table: standard]